MKFTEKVVVALFCIFASAQVEHVASLVKSLENNYQALSTDVQIKWLTQKLDHFSKDNRTWQMRYMENDKYYKDGGPIFIFVGGESAIQANKIQSGIICDLASEHHGILFHTEHRFYGQSQPTGDLSVESMHYLNVMQALEDLAQFIRYQHKTDRSLTKSKVILFGCSYSASIAIWLNKLYPDLVDGVFASSAPLLAQVDFKEYHEIVGQAFQQLDSQKCYDRIKKDVAKLEAMFSDFRAEEAKNRLRLCSKFNYKKETDLWSLFATISIRFAGIVQHQGQKEVTSFCEKIMSSNNDLSIVEAIFPKTIKLCIDATYRSMINFFNKSNNYRAWHYQACNEFGWFKSSTSSKQPFGSTFPISLYTRMCRDLFGDKYSQDYIEKLIAATNKAFGGKTAPLNANKIYMTQGSLDPWRPLGYDKSREIVSVIPEASHCADIGSINKDDNVEMRASKEKLFTLVCEWLR